MIYKHKFGVIFDLDGVIIDSVKVMEHAFVYAFEKFFPLQDAPFHEYIKHSGKGFLKIMEDMGLPSSMHVHFIEKSIELISEVVVFPGIEDMLKTLKINDCYLGIATGKDSFRTNRILKEKNLLDYFDNIICSDQLEYGKPHPASINFHLENSQLEKCNVIFVGDSIIDIQCASNASVSSVAVLWGMTRREDLIRENPDYIANDIGELVNIFNKIGFIQDSQFIAQEVA